MAKKVDYSKLNRQQCISKIVALEINGKQVPTELKERFEQISNEYCIMSSQKLKKAQENVTDEVEED